jgi:glutamyl-tRNA synthetase
LTRQRLVATSRPAWLRLALTARETGPEMAKLLPLIGRAKTSARLSGQGA